MYHSKNIFFCGGGQMRLYISFSIACIVVHNYLINVLLKCSYVTPPHLQGKTNSILTVLDRRLRVTLLLI